MARKVRAKERRWQHKKMMTQTRTAQSNNAARTKHAGDSRPHKTEGEEKTLLTSQQRQLRVMLLNMQILQDNVNNHINTV